MYFLTNIIRVTELRMRWAGNVHGRDEKCRLHFSQKTQGKRPIGRPVHRWKDDDKLDLKKLGYGLIHLAQNMDLWWTHEHDNELSGFIKS
jgi:hypothetical protein